ncbi:MAG: hypothetical protein HY553_10595 [Elusimicrobia bacterium]|nr:hypothetical protein [Elusimicrobiota bacterium]
MRHFRFPAAAALLLAAGAARAQYTPQITAVTNTVPGTVHYQGRLEDNGFPAQGNRNMQFRLYNAAANGTLLWQSGVLPVAINIGIFGVDLNIPIQVLQGAFDKYLEVQVEAATLAPRERLAAVPFALIAKTIEGALDINQGGLTIKHDPAAGTPSFVVSSTTTFVGIGVDPPATKLHLRDGTFTIDGGGGPSIVANRTAVFSGGVTISTIAVSTITGNDGLFITSGKSTHSVILEINGSEFARLDSSGRFWAGAPPTASSFTTRGSLDLFSGSTVAFNGTITLSTATVGTTGLPAIFVDKSGNMVVGSTGSLGGLNRMLTVVGENAGDAVGLELMGNKSAAAQTPASVNFLNRSASQATRYIARVTGGVGQAGDLDSGQLFFVTANAAGGLVSHMALNEDGELGIGNLDPQRRLDVTGDAQFGAAGTKSSFATTGALTMASATDITVSGGGRLKGLPTTCSGTGADAASEGCVATSGGGWQRTGTQVHTRTLGDAVTVWQGSMTVQDTLAVDRNIAAADASFIRLFRQGAEKARIGIDSGDRLSLMAGAADTPALRVDGTGRVGIGTAPSAPLHIDLASSELFRLGRNGVRSHNMRVDASGTLIYGDDNPAGDLTTANNLAITDAGNVGIGTPSPGLTPRNNQSKLEVQGALLITSFPNEDGLAISGAQDNSVIELRTTSAGGKRYQLYSTGGASSMGQGVFALRHQDGVTDPTRLRIDASGDVALGGSFAPSAGQSLVGAHFVTRGSSVAIGGYSPYHRLQVSSGTLLIDGNSGKLEVHNNTVPGLSAGCGAGATIVGSDIAGKITIGTAPTTPCTVTFQAAYANDPICVVSDETTAVALRPVAAVGTLAINGAFAASDVINYICVGRR